MSTKIVDVQLTTSPETTVDILDRLLPWKPLSMNSMIYLGLPNIIGTSSGIESWMRDQVNDIPWVTEYYRNLIGHRELAERPSQ